MSKDIQHKGSDNLSRSGRPKGAKNKTTLFKEAMREGFENKLQVYGEKVFQAVVDKAIEGDMSAAKIILDRIVPVAEVQKSSTGDKFSFNINISSLETNTVEIDSKDIEDVDYEEIEEIDD